MVSTVQMLVGMAIAFVAAQCIQIAIGMLIVLSRPWMRTDTKVFTKAISIATYAFAGSEIWYMHLSMHPERYGNMIQVKYMAYAMMWAFYASAGSLVRTYYHGIPVWDMCLLPMC
jgi:hypothetical protein